MLLALSFTFIGCGENGRDAIDDGKTDPLSQLLQLDDNQEEKR